MKVLGEVCVSSVFKKLNNKWIIAGVFAVTGIVWWMSSGEDASVAKAEKKEQPVIISDEKGVVTAFDSHAMQAKNNKIVPEGVYVPVQAAGMGKMDEAGRVIPPPLPPVRTIVQPGLDPDQLERGVRAHRHPEAIRPEWEHAGDSVSRKESF
jgi:hypothetical protein